MLAFSQESEVNSELQKLVNDKSLLQRDIGFKITDHSESKLSKVQFIYYRQEYNGIEIIGTESNLSLTQNGKVLINRNNFIRNLEEKTISTSRTNTPESALGKLATEMNYEFRNSIYPISTDGNTTYLSDGGISERVIPVKEIFYAEKYSKVKIAWEISIKETDSSDWWNFIINFSSSSRILNDLKSFFSFSFLPS
jgi:Zn-dependent metalloprotease